MAISSIYDIKRRDKATIFDFVDTRVVDARTRMSDLHRDWALSLAWVRGHQNVDFDAKARKWRRAKSTPWQTRLTSNMLLPMVRNKVARSMSFRPMWDVIPATPDQADVDISKTSTKVMQDIWVKQNMVRALHKVLMWRSITGNGFMKVGWDSSKGEEVQVETRQVEDETLRQFLLMVGMEETPETISVRPGELFIDVTSPFNIITDPLVTEFDDSEFIIESSVRSKDALISAYGNKWKDKLTESSESESLITPYVFTNDNEKIDRKGVLVHELFIKHGTRFKKGLYALMADGEFLQPPRDLPFDHGRLPYVQFQEIIDPLSMWAYSLVDQVRPNQARYNRILSALTDSINMTSKVQWIVPRSAKIKSITNRPGAIIEYSGPVAPHESQPRSVPVYVENTLERTRRDMQDTGSFHNVSQAQSEPGLRSGRAILALQDADDSAEGPVFMLLDKSIIDVGRLAIELTNQHATQEQIIQITGEFGELESLTYRQEMLVGESKGNYFNVRVKTFGRQLLSRAGREDQISRFVELGILQVDRDRELILSMIDSADTGQITDEHAQDRTRQWLEIKRMSQGEQVPVVIGEDHATHLTMIKRFMASSQRDKVDPKNMELIQQHYVSHLQIQMSELVQQQAIVMQGMAQLQGLQNDGTKQQAGSGGSGTGSQGTGNNKASTGVNKDAGAGS